MSAVMPLIRPRHLLSALVAMSLALAVPVVAVGSTSAAPVPRPVAARMTSVGLSPAAPDQAARAGSVAAAESSVVETGGSLRVVGVTWPHGDLTAGDRVEIRERANGAWGGWATLEAEDDHGPDPGTAEAKRARGGTEPFITTADAVQVRVLGQHRSAGASARLDVVDPRSSAADHAAAPTAGAADAGSVRPTIYSRAKWGADESLKRGTPSYGTIRSAVVHHTAGSNSYTADQVPAILRGIYDFHVNGRGWNDVGYNFFIDKFGRIWEGRAGGTDLPVVGAQAGGYNSQTFGASTLGDFTSVAPPAAVVTAQSKLIAWKLGLTNIDPTGTTVIDGKGTLPRVIGHRNLNQTSCPGAKYYALLPGIRTRAKAYQGTMLYEPTPEHHLAAVRQRHGHGQGPRVDVGELDAVGVERVPHRGAVHPQGHREHQHPGVGDLVREARRRARRSSGAVPPHRDREQRHRHRGHLGAGGAHRHRPGRPRRPGRLLPAPPGRRRPVRDGRRRGARAGALRPHHRPRQW